MLADTVDHVVAINDGGPAFPGHDGLASYCTACHSRKTARGSEAGAARTTKPRRGCNPDGSPIDAAHPWKKSLGADALRPRMVPFLELVQEKNKKAERHGG
ncbi:hypothetical protein KIH45_03875 [Croceicoccus sp. 1NDH52]|nr:hypothetical protein [Croceicoccus gelatinilyticus]